MKNKIYRTVIVEDRLPENDGCYITNIGAQKFEFIGKGWSRGLEDLESVEWWLEEIELPDDKEIQEAFSKSDIGNIEGSEFHEGANFILNKLKRG